MAALPLWLLLVRIQAGLKQFDGSLGLFRVVDPKFNRYRFKANMATGSVKLILDKTVDVIEFQQRFCGTDYGQIFMGEDFVQSNSSLSLALFYEGRSLFGNHYSWCVGIA